MKKLLATISMVAAGLYAAAQTQVIDYPVTEKRSTESLEIYRAVVSDTAVILEGNLYNLPKYWVSLASSSILKGRNTGKSYRLVRASGIELDKQIYMPETWTKAFVLQFEPIDVRDELVDFDETPAKADGFKVNGIAMKKKKENKRICCRIQGTTTNPAYSRIMLEPEGNDERVNDWISIPVHDGKFTYDFYTDEESPYSLTAWSDIKQGRWMSANFFAENGELQVTMTSIEEEPQVKTTDMVITKELCRINDEAKRLYILPIKTAMDKLEQDGNDMTSEMKALRKEIQSEKDETRKKELYEKGSQLYNSGEAFTPEYKAMIEQSKDAWNKWRAYMMEYVSENPTLVGLYLLKEQALMARSMQREGTVDMRPYLDQFTAKYEQKYAGNPLALFMQNLMMSEKVKVGGKFIDFTAPDLNGTLHTASKEIAGKIALIDLWASWCGPCRRTSKSMIPVYEAFKDKGFTVLGIARERKANDMKVAMEKDRYTWLNLLEINDEGKIWEKYGVGNGGGCTYLVDKEGTILAIHPTAEEVKAILEKLL